MSKTAFSRNCDILGEWWEVFGNSKDLDSDWKEFRKDHCVALHEAYLISQHHYPITDESEKLIQDAWLVYCSYLGIYNYYTYDNMQATFDQAQFYRDHWDDDDD